MADIADITDDRIEIATNDAITESSRAVAAMPKGEPGDCDKCGETMPRLVNGWCCRCRDKYKMKYQ